MKNVLTVCLLVITIMGLVTFSLFICEEAMQTVMFGTWAAQDAGDWNTVKKGIDLNRRINRGMDTINNCAGWIQPLSWYAYGSYADSMDYYILALEKKVIAHAPELFEGHEIKFLAIHAEVQQNKQVKLSNGRYFTYQSLPAPSLPVEITGKIHVIEDKIFIAQTNDY